MDNPNQAQAEPIYRPVILRRDGLKPFRFQGEKIGGVSRSVIAKGNDNVERLFETSARLYNTSHGQVVVGVAVYNRTDEGHEVREAFKADSLPKLVETLKAKSSALDDDMLAELFEDTEVEDLLVEDVE